MSVKFKKDICKLISRQLGIDTSNLGDKELIDIVSLEFKKGDYSEQKLNKVLKSIDKLGEDLTTKEQKNKQIRTVEKALHLFTEGVQKSALSVIHLQEVINCVPEMIFVLDSQFQITEVNKAVNTILHKKDETIIGHDVLDFVIEKDLLAGLLLDRFFNEEFTFLNHSLEEIPTTVHVERIKNAIGQSEGFVLVAVDQRINKSRENTLISERKKAEELTQAKAEFLSVMSHEIRTPLNAVVGLSEILENNGPRPDQLELIKTLKFSGENLTSLINDILDYSKIEAGKVVLENIPVDLNEILKNVQRSLLFKAKENQNEVFLNCPSSLPSVYGDRVRLVQILTNLIGNSVKFTKSGTIEVTVKEVDRKEDSVDVLFSVRDTGVGIAENNLSHIFEKFSQAESGTTRKFGGTGLGLTITKNLVRLHKSEIFVESEIGVGTTFYFTVNFKLCKELVEHGEHHLSLKSLKEKRVLLAEDNAVNVMVACNFLDQLDVTYDVAENGEQAFEMAVSNHYDVILMDLQMPIMDGFESAEKIISMKVKTPIIALTASALIEDQVQAKKAGMVDFISKPFKSEELNVKLLMYS